MPSVRRLCFLALGGAVGLAVAVVVAWAADSALAGGAVARNTEIAGRPAGGMSKAQLHRLVADVAGKYRTSPVVIEAPHGGFTTNAHDLGLGIDTAATERAALKTGRRGNIVGRIASWAHGFLNARDVPVQVTVDEHAVRAVVAAKDPGPRTAPVEPLLKPRSNNTGFLVIDGKPGKGIDPTEVVKALPTAAAPGGPVRVKVGRGEVKPEFTKQDVEALHSDATKATAKSLPVTAGDVTVNIAPSTLRSWTKSDVSGDHLHLTVDATKTSRDLARLLAKAAVAPVQTSFTVQNGVPVAKAGTPGSACCSSDAPRLIAEALFANDDDGGSGATPVELPMKVVKPAVPAEAIDDLGVKQLVSSFTTNYPAGQPRVTNIHKIADIVKGTLIPPGGTFSLNGTVGQRTLDKGFVVDHQINDNGEFDEAVGGGVSQFATTTFNAAFFAGLDYGEYQSHSIYISRYPFGREATVSWQHPDLQIKNTTPYGIVIWASYTGTSVTVSMYSTKYFESVTQSAQTQAPIGPGCTRVVTERTRNYLDGRSAVDKVYATYQPKEGVKCR